MMRRFSARMRLSFGRRREGCEPRTKRNVALGVLKPRYDGDTGFVYAHESSFHVTVVVGLPRGARSCCRVGE